MNEKKNDINKILHDLRSKTASFNTGISLLTDRIEAKEDYLELIPLMNDSLENVMKNWEELQGTLKTWHF